MARSTLHVLWRTIEVFRHSILSAILAQEHAIGHCAHFGQVPCNSMV